MAHAQFQNAELAKGFQQSILKGKQEWGMDGWLLQNFLVLESFLFLCCPYRSGHNDPVNLQQDKHFCNLC